MGEVNIDAEEAILSCEKILGKHGRLSTAIPEFTPRAQQIELCLAITKTIFEKSTLVAEAGTGTGKTFAYLIPSLISGKKTIISTATKTLQDQLFFKDIPRLIRALGVSTRVQNLKGRANYLCKQRIEQYTEEGHFVNKQQIHELLHVREKLPQLTFGERSELPEISEDSAIWPFVTSTADNCLGSDCKFHQECYLIKARKRAMEADVVVINHHLFMADSQLKQEGFGELLPGVDVIIFDEAHQLSEIAINFYGERLGTRQFIDLIDDILHAWPVLDQANQPLNKIRFEVEQVVEQLVLALPVAEEKFSWNTIAQKATIKKGWEQFLIGIEKIITWLATTSHEENTPLMRHIKRLEDFQALALRFDKPEKNLIRWLERFKHSVVFHATPFEISSSFKQLLIAQKCAYIFTSATLTMASSFSYFLKPLGLEDAATLLLPSPFDYQQQALLYLPRSLPDPSHDNYYDELINRAMPIIQAFGGRSFFLFTSHRALKLVAQRLVDTLNYPLLVQGDEAKPILLARFREMKNAVLLGTATFWEGVDVKGDALSCVIIDKLPFANPNCPVMQGKMTYLKSLGLSGFDEISLPGAILALKQGIGRLIRDENDKGVLMIADPRLTSRNYGHTVFASLPSLRKTRDEQTVLKFIEDLALNYETTGH